MNFADGGYIPPHPQNAKKVTLSRGTYIISAATAQRYGRRLLEELFPTADIVEVEEVPEET